MAGALVAVAFAGCLKLTNDGFACGSGGACPPGYHCATDKRCWKLNQNPSQSGNDLSASVSGDLGGVDLSSGCAQAKDCPPGQSCDTTKGVCTTACSASQPCNGGCCDGTTCAPGTALDKCGSSGACVACQTGEACQAGVCGLACSASAPCNGGCCDSVMLQCATGTTSGQCALGGALCGSCVGSSAGTTCVATGASASCGCNSVSDCPLNQACNMKTHTCGTACDTATPCKGGCCSAASGGTCQPGTLNPTCGANGGLCSDCSANQNGHVCVSVSGGGQCGCAMLSDCPGTSSSCTNKLCVNACSTGMPCQSGCCSDANSGVCNPGTADTLCGIAGSICQPCSGNANGHVCLSTSVCGCTKAADCPSGQACDATHGKCTTACGSNQACNGGCCSAPSGGTCQLGNTTGACGNSGVCAACPGNTTCTLYSCNGSACIPSYLSSTTTCDDGNPCTYNDACNGTGGCAGAAVSCPANTACTSYSCNGTSSCTISYAPNTTECGKGSNCCTGGPSHCDGSGTCLPNGCCNTLACCTK